MSESVAASDYDVNKTPTVGTAIADILKIKPNKKRRREEHDDDDTYIPSYVTHTRQERKRTFWAFNDILIFRQAIIECKDNIAQVQTDYLPQYTINDLVQRYRTEFGFIPKDMLIYQM